MAVTLGELRTNVQVLYDIAGSGVLSAAEWNTVIQRSYKALWNEIVAIMPTFRATTTNFTLTTTQTQALPSDFRQVLKVLKDPGTANETILPNFATRIAHAAFENSYRLQGTNLVIEPLSRCAGNFAIVYVPTCPVLSNDSTQVDAELDQFEDFITYKSVIEAQSREETDAGQFASLLTDATARVKRYASDQRKSDPDTVDDVRGSNDWGWAGRAW